MSAGLPPGLADIDWSPPWLAPCRAAGQRITERLRAGCSVAEALNAEIDREPVALVGGGLRFVPQADLPAGVAYEAHIAATARVPTRDNRHDLFNGLVWLTFPRLKRALNQAQAAQLRAHGVGPTRGRLRDALTVFDENAAWLQAPPVLVDALRRRDWDALFLRHRVAWADARLTLFGHALLDKLCAPRPAITAHVVIVPAGPTRADLAVEPESWLCERLATAPSFFDQRHPLPVLGLPGWWPPNASPGFYADACVFRPAPSR